MNFLLTLHRRIEWQHLFSYIAIVVVEIIVLRSISGSPEANVIRYFTFFTVVFLSVWVARRHIIKPIQEIKQASLHIAEGNYHDRLPSYSSIELNELAQAFNQMAETLHSTEQRRVELIGNVAHELRTPLSNIKVTMEGLIDHALSAEPATFFSILREVSRLQRLVHQLEELSRVESGQISLKKELVDQRSVVRDVCHRLGIQYEDKGVTLNLTGPETLPQLYVDRDLITQVLINLLGNALQYTPSGGTVTIRLTHKQSFVTCEVTDTGIGIPPDQLVRIFERFYRVDKSRARSTGGNGIGLTIAKHLIQAHGGQIWASSEGDGHGTTISFTLPISSRQ